MSLWYSWCCLMKYNCIWWLSTETMPVCVVHSFVLRRQFGSYSLWDGLHVTKGLHLLAQSGHVNRTELGQHGTKVKVQATAEHIAEGLCTAAQADGNTQADGSAANGIHLFDLPKTVDIAGCLKHRQHALNLLMKGIHRTHRPIKWWTSYSNKYLQFSCYRFLAARSCFHTISQNEILHNLIKRLQLHYYLCFITNWF